MIAYPEISIEQKHRPTLKPAQQVDSRADVTKFATQELLKRFKLEILIWLYE